jgi:hypothetical protein
MYSTFVFPHGNCVILRHCIKWRNHSRLIRQERESGSVTLCCRTDIRQAATRLGFEPSASHSYVEDRFMEIVNGDDTFVHGSGILRCGALSLDECLSTFRTVLISSPSASTIYVTLEDVDITMRRKRREILIQWHDVTSQNTIILSNTAVRDWLTSVLDVMHVCTLCVGRVSGGSVVC